MHYFSQRHVQNFQNGMSDIVEKHAKHAIGYHHWDSFPRDNKLGRLLSNIQKLCSETTLVPLVSCAFQLNPAHKNS